MQGVLLHGYREMHELTLLFLRIEDPVACGAWLRELADTVLTTADPTEHKLRARRDGKDYARVNVALTARGLAALGLPEEVLATLPPELREGMARRAQEHLRDVDGNAPERWQFGGTHGGDDIHLLLMLYAADGERMERLRHDYRIRAAQQGLREVHVQRCSRQHRPGDPPGYFRDHFGFLDGLSQPRIEGFQDPAGHPNDYDRPLKTGELILGHDNEYGERSPSPRVPEAMPGADPLPDVPDHPGWKDLGSNGSYMVVRKLEQDVAAFEEFLRANASIAPEGTHEDRREWLAAKLVGRWRNGSPLVASKGCPLHRLFPFLFRKEKAKPPRLPQHDAEAIDNSFLYARDDPHGYGCPVTAHARRCNPRDAMPPSRHSSMKVTRRHRILRRGFNYEDASGKGLMFIALNTHVSRQFEFIQRSWVHYDQLEGMEGAEDPLTGDGGGRLIIPQRPLRQCVAGLQQFVKTRGGGYFFLPGVKALRLIADRGQAGSAAPRT